MGVAEAGGARKGTKRVAAFVTAALGTVAALGAFLATGLGDRTCRFTAEMGLFVPTACPDTYRPVPLDDATQFLDKFIGRAGASAPERAWQMMSAEMRQQIAREAFAAEWNFDWAERTGVIRPGSSYNAFDVTYRTYRGVTDKDHDYTADSGEVADHHETYVLRYSDAVDLATGLSLEVSGAGGRVRDDVERIYLEKVRLTRAVKPMERPRSNAQTVGIRVGPGWLSVYCAIDNPQGGQWLRTGLGWVSVADTDRAVQGVPTRACDPHHLSSPTGS